VEKQGGIWRVWEEGDASFLGGIFGLCVVSVVLHAVQFGVILSNSGRSRKYIGKCCILPESCVSVSKFTDAVSG
jgi:hypothetical protein